VLGSVFMRKDELTVEPYTAPGRYEGLPAYTYMGVQVIKHIIDGFTDKRLLGFARQYDRYAQRTNPDKLEANVYAQIAVARMIDEMDRG